MSKVWRAFPVIFIAGPVFADSYLSFLDLPKASLFQSIVLISTLIAGFGSILGVGIVGIHRQRKREKSTSEMRLTVNCRRFDLDEQEEKKLRDMISRVPISDPNDIFDSPQIFEQAVDKEVNGSILNVPPELHQSAEDLIASIRSKLHFRTIDEGAPLVSTRNMPTGQRVSLVMNHCEAMVSANKEFHFSLKVDKTDSTPALSTGALLRIAFARKNDALYGAEVVIISCDTSGYIRCRHTAVMKRNQLRRDVRLGVSSGIKLRVHRRADPEKPRDMHLFQARMVDISGGGISFVSDMDLSIGDVLYLESSGPVVPAAGIVLQILATSKAPAAPSKDDVTKPGKRYHGQFINIGFDKKEKIVRYIFERMRELNKR